MSSFARAWLCITKFGILATHLRCSAIPSLSSRWDEVLSAKVAGAIASATHGAGQENGNLATVRATEFFFCGFELNTDPFFFGGQL